MDYDLSQSGSFEIPASLRRIPRAKIITLSVLVLMAAAAFGAVFTVLTLHNLYLQSIASEYRLPARQLQADLGVNPATPAPARLHKIAATLAQIADKNIRTQNSDPNTTSVRPANAPAPVMVVDTTGTITTSTAGTLRAQARTVSAEARKQIAHAAMAEPGAVPPWTYVTTAAGMSIILPATGPDGSAEQFVVLNIPADASTDLADAFSRRFAYDTVLILLAGAFVVLFLIHHLVRESLAPDPRLHRRIMAGLFVTLVTIQCAATSLGLLTFKHSYSGISKTKAEVILNLIKSDIEPYLAIGIRIELFADMETYLQKWIDTHAELSGIAIRNIRSEVIFDVDEHASDEHTSTSFGDILARQFRPWELSKTAAMDSVLVGSNGPAAIVSARFSEVALYRHLYDTFINGLTIVVIATLVAVEVLTLVFHYMARMTKSRRSRESRYMVMRPAMFFFLFGIDISMSFVPLQMERVFEPMLGLSKDVIIGLPVSAEFLAVGVAILLSGVWSDRRGWQEPFLGGVLLAALGMYYSSIADSPIMFIISRGIVGVGFGLVLLASQSFVVAHTSKKNKTLGLAHLFAGLYAGSICGSAVGAMLADWFDYATVFIIGYGLLLGVFAFGVIFMDQSRQSRGARPAATRRPILTRQRLNTFLTDRKVLSVTLLCSLPAAVAVVGFLNYFSPVYLDRLGSSQTTIGQALMVYGMSMVILGPYIGRRIDGYADKRYAMLIGTMLGACAFLTFAVLDGLGAVFIGMVLLGLSSSFVLASQSAYLLTLEATKAIGDGLAMALFRSSSRVGQVLGPAVFAGFVGATSSVTGIVYFGAIYLALGLLFMLFSRARLGGLWWPASLRGSRALRDAPTQS